MMQNSTPDVIEQVPAGGGVNKPSSGTYGEKAQLDQLRRDLPQVDQSSSTAGRQVQPVPGGGLRPGGGASAPAGLPAGLTAPTRQPDVPISTPMAQPPDPMAGAVDARQRRLRYLDLLSQHADSPEVREWAEVVKQKLIARG